MRSAQTVRDQLHYLRAFEPNNPKIADLEVELVAARKGERERREARKAVLAGIGTATHVRLKDGWVEVVAIEKRDEQVVVQNGENRRERFSFRSVLEVKAL